MGKFFNEFKQFAIRGNVVDLAVGVIIGGALGKIVSSLVNDIAMPLIGIIIGDISIKNINLGPIALGNFINAAVDFLVIAFSIFLMVKIVAKLRKKEGPLFLETSKEEELLKEIRDLLKENNRR